MGSPEEKCRAKVGWTSSKMIINNHCYPENNEPTCIEYNEYNRELAM